MLNMFQRSQSKVQTTSQDAQTDGDRLAVIEVAINRLSAAIEDAAARYARAKEDADRCRANVATTHPHALHNALLEEQSANAAYEAALSRQQEEAPRLAAERDAIHSKAAGAAREAKVQAYREAMKAYRDQCHALIRPALNVRKLAREAGVFLPARDATDLLFDSQAEPHVAGSYIEIWTLG